MYGRDNCSACEPADDSSLTLWANWCPSPPSPQPTHTTLQELNYAFSARLKELLSPDQVRQTDDVAIISVDRMGIDVRVRFGHDYNVERVGFNTVSCSLCCVSSYILGPAELIVA